MSALKRTIHAVFNDRKAQIVTLASLAIALGILLLQTYGKAYRPAGYDFSSYLLSAVALLSGHDPYHTASSFPFIYPLFLPFVLIPLTFLPYWFSVLLWFFLNVFSLALSVRILVDSAYLTDEGGVNQGLYVPLALLFFIFFSVIQNNLLNGQVNFIVLLFCLLFFEKYLAGQKILAALFLAIAVSLKLMPVVLCAYLVVRKDYRSVLLSLGMTLLLCFSPALVLGWKTMSFFGEYLNSFVLHQVAGNASAMDGSIYFSLSGFFAHVLPWTDHIPGHNLIFACVVMAIVLVPDICRRNRGLGERESWLISMYLLAIPLLSPVSEKHHLAFIFPAICLCVLTLVPRRKEFAFRKAVALLSVMGLYLTSRLYPEGPFIFFSIMVLLICTTTSLFVGNECELESADA